MKIKRICRLALIVITALSLLMLIQVPMMAADIQGDWEVFGSSGYVYNEEGISIYYPNYNAGKLPFVNVQSKDPVCIQENVYLEFRIDNFSYKGESGQCDEWISIHLIDQLGFTPGSAAGGSGWGCIIRGNGDGAATCESFASDQSTGSFIGMGTVDITPKLDEQGREVYTLEATWDGSAYKIKVCDTAVAGAYNIILKKASPEGNYHVGVTLHSTDSTEGAADFTITKFGASAEDALVPVGSDSREPEENTYEEVPIMDPDTVPAGQPALLWNATTIEEQDGTNLLFTAQGDSSYRVTATSSAGFFSWVMSPDISYDSADFPVFAMLLRNYWGDSSSFLFYCGGDVRAPSMGLNNTFWNMFADGSDGFSYAQSYGDDNEYALVMVYLSPEWWSGRINAFRVDFTGINMNDESATQWDICYMGAFRNIEEAEAYGAAYCGVDEDTTTDNNIDTEDVPDTDTTDASTTEAPTDAPATDAPATDAPATDDQTETDASVKSGCTSVVSFGAATVLAAAAAVVALKKKD